MVLAHSLPHLQAGSLSTLERRARHKRKPIDDGRSTAIDESIEASWVRQASAQMKGIVSCRHANQGLCNGCPAKEMSKTIRNVDFLVPIRTVSEMNDRSHWAVRLKRKHNQQLELIAAWQNNVGGRKVELPCVVRLTRVGPKNLDGDNLQGGMKFLRDAVAQKLGVDDGSDLIKWEYSQIANGRREYGVKVTITSQS